MERLCKRTKETNGNAGPWRVKMRHVGTAVTGLQYRMDTDRRCRSSNVGNRSPGKANGSLSEACSVANRLKWTAKYHAPCRLVDWINGFASLIRRRHHVSNTGRGISVGWNLFLVFFRSGFVFQEMRSGKKFLFYSISYSSTANSGSSSTTCRRRGCRRRNPFG